MSLSNPRDLLLHQLAELLWIERTLFDDVLPSVHDDAHSPQLQQALTAHRAETREHCSRLEQAFRACGAEPAAARSQSLAALAEQHERDAQSIPNRELRDDFHCDGVARTEHLELAAYDAAMAVAEQVGVGDCRRLLEENREEDAAALTRVARLRSR